MTTSTSPDSGPESADPFHSCNLTVGRDDCVALPNHSCYNLLMRLSLPGVVIFVHGGATHCTSWSGIE
jgi:hypothetical protein